MNQYINVQTFGRTIIASRDNPRIAVNRLWYVNSGTAVITNATNTITILPGKIYILPQSDVFKIVSADQLDITFFNFYSSRILCHDSIHCFDAEGFPHLSFFEYAGSLGPAPITNIYRSAMGHMFTGFLMLLEKYYPIPYLNDTDISQAVTLIHEDIAHITTASLAQSLNLNISYFIRKFKASMGFSPMQYILSCRLTYAQNYLVQGYSVSDTAELIGYATVSAFSKAYKKKFGKPPTQL